LVVVSSALAAASSCCKVLFCLVYCHVAVLLLLLGSCQRCRSSSPDAVRRVWKRCSWSVLRSFYMFQGFRLGQILRGGGPAQATASFCRKRSLPTVAAWSAWSAR
jgi:hypothetical protein